MASMCHENSNVHLILYRLPLWVRSCSRRNTLTPSKTSNAFLRKSLSWSSQVSRTAWMLPALLCSSRDAVKSWSASIASLYLFIYLEHSWWVGRCNRTIKLRPRCQHEACPHVFHLNRLRKRIQRWSPSQILLQPWSHFPERLTRA